MRKKVPRGSSYKMYLSGGGAHNPLLVSWIRELLPHFLIENIETLGVPGDAKEAILFAVLANETVAGKTMKFGKGIPSVSMGKVSFPL